MRIFCAALFVGLFTTFAYTQNANVAPFPASRATAEAKPLTATIRGKVIYEDSGKPVRRASVGLMTAPKKRKASDSSGETYIDYPNSDGVREITDDAGEFTFKTVKAGDYFPIVDVQGVLNPNNYKDFGGYGYGSSTGMLDEFFERIVIDGANDLTILIKAKRGASITGRITYSDGDPAVSVKIEALRKGDYGFESSYTENTSTTKSDDRGIYRFAGLPPGEYVVRITESADHSVSEERYSEPKSILRTYYPGTANAKKAKIFELNLGQEQSGVDISISDKTLFKLTGSVIAKNSKKPLASIQVALQKIDDVGVVDESNSGIFQISVSTDEQGSWVFKDLPKGKYRLDFERPTYGLNPNESKETPKYAKTSREFVIGEIEAEKIVIELPLESTISGSIVAEGKKELPPGLVIVAYDRKSKAFAYVSLSGAIADDQQAKDKLSRKFLLSGLSEGSYGVYLSSESGNYIKSAKSGSLDLTTSTLDLKEGVDVEGVQIVLATDFALVKGKVLDADKRPVRGANITLIPQDEGKQGTGVFIRSAKTDSNGEFQLKAAPGDYFVVAFDDSFSDAEEESSADEFIKKVTKDADRITVKSGENPPVILRLLKL